MTTIYNLLQQLAREQFYGSVELKIEAGKVVLVRKTESIKPVEDNYRNNRGYENATKEAQ